MFLNKHKNEKKIRTGKKPAVEFFLSRKPPTIHTNYTILICSSACLYCFLFLTPLPPPPFSFFSLSNTGCFFIFFIHVCQHTETRSASILPCSKRALKSQSGKNTLHSFTLFCQKPKERNGTDLSPQQKGAGSILPNLDPPTTQRCCSAESLIDPGTQCHLSPQLHSLHSLQACPYSTLV